MEVFQLTFEFLILANLLSLAALFAVLWTLLLARVCHLPSMTFVRLLIGKEEPTGSLLSGWVFFSLAVLLVFLIFASVLPLNLLFPHFSSLVS